MDTTLIIVLAVGLFVVGIFIVIAIRRRDFQTYEPQPFSAPQPGVMPSVAPEVLAEISGLLFTGKKIEAIKRLREATGIGLKEAKDYVEALERGAPPPALLPQMPREMPTASGITPELTAEVRQLLARRQKIEAVKRVREATGWGLKESKDYVDALE